MKEAKNYRPSRAYSKASNRSLAWCQYLVCGLFYTETVLDWRDRGRMVEISTANSSRCGYEMENLCGSKTLVVTYRAYEGTVTCSSANGHLSIRDLVEGARMKRSVLDIISQTSSIEGTVQRH